MEEPEDVEACCLLLSLPLLIYFMHNIYATNLFPVECEEFLSCYEERGCGWAPSQHTAFGSFPPGELRLKGLSGVTVAVYRNFIFDLFIHFLYICETLMDIY